MLKNKHILGGIAGVVLGAQLFIPVQAEAAFAFVRAIDGWKESLIYSALIETRTYTEMILESVNGLKAIADLKNLVGQFAGLKEIVETVQEVSHLKDEIVGEVMGSINEVMDLKNMAVSLPDNLKNQFSSQGITGLINLSGSYSVSTTKGKSQINFNPDRNGATVMDALNSGEYGVGAGQAVDNIKEILSASLNLSGDKTSSTLSGKQKSDADGAAKSALKIAVETVPLSFPGMQLSLAELGGKSKMSDPQKRMYALSVAEESRAGAIEQIAKTIAPYTVPVSSDASYRRKIAALDEQSKKALEKTIELSGGGPSAAMRTIASLSAVLVEQTALQNRYLVELTDAIADNIKISGINALLSIEGYSNGVRENTQNFIEQTELLAR